MQERHATFLALGSNLPANYVSSVDLLHAAIAAIAAARVRVVAVSSFYRTRPFGPSQPDYVNLVLKVNTVLGARGLLHEMQGVEAAFGRAREAKWGPRTLDLDLLAVRGGAPPLSVICESEELTLPHPRLHLRRFVLAPWAELSPQLEVSPVLGCVRELLDRCPDSCLIERIINSP